MTGTAVLVSATQVSKVGRTKFGGLVPLCRGEGKAFGVALLVQGDSSVPSE